MLLAIFLVGLLAVGVVSAADNTTDDNMIGEEPNTDLTAPDTDDVLTADEQNFTQLNQAINGNSNSEITLTSDYKYSNGDDNFKKGIFINRDVTINGNGHTINGSGEARIFYITGGNVVFYNITFVNANADNGYYDAGGAIFGVCRAINCTFKENHVNYNGGAMAWGSAVNCAFFGNSANSAGGAMRGGSAVNCTFSGNTVLYNGGAIAETCAVNCTFTNNSAGYNGGAIYIGSAVNCAFFGNSANKGRAMDTGYKFDCRGTDDFSNTENLELHWEVDNFNSTYGSDKTLPIKLMNQNSYYDDWVWVGFINYDVVIYKNGNKVKTYHCLSNDDLSFDLAFGNYTAELIVTYPGLNQLNPKNITLTINKATPKIEVYANDVTYPGNVVVNVKSNVTGEYLVKVGDMTQKVNLEAGIVKDINFTGLAANEKGYVVNVTSGSENYACLNDNVTVKVKKATPSLTASAKSFKFEDKNKKYTVTLKDSKGNAIKNTRVTLKVNGVTYTATTNANGVATFALTKLTKTGNAVITYPGDNIYKQATKKVKLTVKAPVFKTVSYGSKDKAMVKKIQKALKKNGFYIKEKGRYLKIDGIFHKYTVKAVKQFQKAKGLKVTGKVDYATAKKLKIVK